LGGGPPAPVDEFIEYAVANQFHARLGVPRGWRGVELRNRMGDFQEGALVRPADKSAVVVMMDASATHDLLLDRRADAALTISAGLSAIWWDREVSDVAHGEVAATLERGVGILAERRMALVQLRARFPSPIDGPSTMLVVGALRTDATPQRRGEYAAALASFRFAVGDAPSRGGLKAPR
jgi:hypothetical protein